MRRTSSVVLLSLLVIVSGCGKGGIPVPGGNGGNAGGNNPAGAGPQRQAANGSQTSSNLSAFVNDANKTVELLGRINQEMDRLTNSGEQFVDIAETPKLNQQLKGVYSRLISLGAPSLADARQLKSNALPQLANAIKAARLANSRFRQKYRQMFSFNQGDEVGNGVATAGQIFSHLQKNLPEGERLTFGAPRSIGTLPRTNVSYGALAELGYDSDDYETSRFGTRKVREHFPWQVTVDPAPASDENALSADAKLGIEVPHVDFRGSIIHQPVKVLYPATPGPCVAVGLNQNVSQTRTVWNLKTRKRLGTIKGIQLKSRSSLALSPNGKYFAGRPEGTNIIGLWDIDAAKAIKTINLTAAGTPSMLAFADDHRLITVAGVMLYVYKMPSGELEREVELKRIVPTSSFHSGTAWAISPGGRYLALSEPGERDVLFVDITTGEKVGRIDVTEDITVRWIAVDFSHNGKQMAIVVDGAFTSEIQIWDVAKGRPTANFQYDTNLGAHAPGDRSYQGPSLDWFPDNRRLLIYGRGIFNTETGTLEKVLPASTTYHLRPFVGDQLIIVEGGKLAPFDFSKIDSIPTVAKRGEIKPPSTTAEPDPNEDPNSLLTEVDRSQQKNPTQQGAAAWKVAADPAPPVAGGDFQIKGLSHASAFKNVLVHVAIAAGGQRAAVGYSSKRVSLWSGKISQIDDAKTWIEHFEPAAGAAPQRFEFPFPAALQAISPSGNVVCTKALEELSRLDCWNITTNQRQFGFQPYTEGTTSGSPVIWADFLDEDKLLTLGAGRLTLWQIPDCRAVWEIPLATSNRPIFSPGRRYLAAQVDGESGSHYQIIQCADGTIAGQIGLQDNHGKLSTIAFSRDGSRLALVSATATTGFLTLVDVAAGQVQESFPVSVTGKNAHWCDSDHLLLDGSFLVNLPKKMAAWNYRLGQGYLAANSPDGRLWYLSGVHRQSLTLTAAQIPDPAATKAIAGGQLKKVVALQPGGTVQFDIQISNPPGQTNFGQKVADSFTKQLQAAQITVDPASPLRIVVRGKMEKTGEALSNGIDQLQVLWIVSVMQGDDILWRQTTRARNSESLVRNGQTTATQDLTNQMWQRASTRLLNFSLPTYIFGPNASQGLGITNLTANGPEPVPLSN